MLNLAQSQVRGLRGDAPVIRKSSKSRRWETAHQWNCSLSPFSPWAGFQRTRREGLEERLRDFRNSVVALSFVAQRFGCPGTPHNCFATDSRVHVLRGGSPVTPRRGRLRWQKLSLAGLNQSKALPRVRCCSAQTCSAQTCCSAQTSSDTTSTSVERHAPFTNCSRSDAEVARRWEYRPRRRIQLLRQRRSL
jgi:hypothetical protein